MSTIQNLKNFIRHGKQARAPNVPAHGDPTTNVSPVHAHQQQNRHGVRSHALSDPEMMTDHRAHHGVVTRGEYSAADVDARNVVAQAGAAAAQATAGKRRLDGRGVQEREKKYDPTVIEQIVAEERESKGKLPKYPGLERWTLVEKMGDGAFSNVYRAKDNTGKLGDVAIKVVRKFEMSSNQVCEAKPAVLHDTPHLSSRQSFFHRSLGLASVYPFQISR